MQKKYILAVDQGTTNTKAIVFDLKGQVIAKDFVQTNASYPQPGWVEQDPEEIYQSVLRAVQLCIEKLDDASNILCCGITNQRETIMAWDENGDPLYPAIVWQCKRSINTCDRLKKENLEPEISARTGLIIDPYFSGTKIIWLAENCKKFRDALAQGKAFIGTVDTWLLYKLTNGKSYYTDHSNASRTLLFNINDLQWDEFLIEKFGLKGINLPEVKWSDFDFGESDFNGILSHKIKITGLIGDSHAAAFGEKCFTSGTAKITLGTGSSILMNTGDKRIKSKTGMVSTICWSIKNRVDCALEGIIVSCGSTLQWLKQELGLMPGVIEGEEMAYSVTDNNGVYFIPAFSGLGAPHWKMDLKAQIVGLTFGCNKNHVIRAAFESIPYQIKDVIHAMEIDSGIQLKEIRADGGITKSKLVMQCIADLLNCKIENIGIADVSALGAACMAGLGAGVYKDLTDLEKLQLQQKEFIPGSNQQKAIQGYVGWQKILGELP
jgi:glycerol kinase